MGAVAGILRAPCGLSDSGGYFASAAGTGVRDVMDRIYLLYTSNALVPIRTEVLGESGPTTDLTLEPWPSDHRAMRVAFARL